MPGSGALQKASLDAFGRRAAIGCLSPFDEFFTGEVADRCDLLLQLVIDPHVVQPAFSVSMMR
jgi:hypothetical protein